MPNCSKTSLFALKSETYWKDHSPDESWRTTNVKAFKLDGPATRLKVGILLVQLMVVLPNGGVLVPD